MITAVDTNILLDIFSADPNHGDRSLATAQQAANEGSLVICEIVFAELCQPFERLSDLKRTLDRLGIRSEPLGEEACFLAGQTFKTYRKEGGKRDRVLADFLIGAHAQTRCSRLLTRDRGYYRKYFPNLTVMEPSPT